MIKKERVYQRKYFYAKIYVPKRKVYSQFYITPSLFLEIGHGFFNINLDFLIFSVGYWYSKE